MPKNKTKTLANRVVDQMYNNDAFSQWLEIKRIEDAPGKSILNCMVRPEMLNGFKIAHGGIAYSLADSALAFAANAYGTKCVTIQNSFSYFQPIKAGMRLTAIAVEESKTNKTGTYRVEIKTPDGSLVALMIGTVHRTNKEWFS